MAIYQATLRSTYAGQRCINRWTYVSTVEPVGVNGSNVLAQLMGAAPLVGSLFPDDTLLLGVQGLVVPQFAFDELEVLNLYDDADFYVYPFTDSPVGVADSGTAMSPFVTYGFVSNRVTRAIHRATKRFSGVGENWVAAGGYIEATAFTHLDFVGEKMTAVLNPDNTDSHGVYTPAVASFKEYTTPKGNKAYQPWPTEGEQLAHMAVGITWDFYPSVRSQVSRQLGRGE